MAGPGVTHTDLTPLIQQVVQEFQTGVGWSPQELHALTVAAQILKWANDPPTQIVTAKEPLILGEVRFGPPAPFRNPNQ